MSVATRISCLAIGTVVAVACSGSGTGGGSGSDSGSGGQAGNRGLFTPDDGGGSGDGSIEDKIKDLVGEGCAQETARGEAIPAVLMLLVDTSGSMGRNAPGSGRSKWEVTHDALLEAVDNMPGSTAVGGVFYPGMDTSPGGPCFRERLAIPVLLLEEAGSTHRGRIVQRLGEVDPEGGTPTHDAYQYALGRLQDADVPGDKYMVLITDGTPTFSLGCVGTGNVSDPVNPQPIIDEAASAFSNNVRTFVIGSPGSEGARDSLSEIASQGGTAPPGCSDSGPDFCHFDMTTEPDLGVALRGALEEITGQTVSCNYVIPTDEDVDPSKVNLVFTPGGGDPEEILRDPSDTGCTSGWQYTNNERQIQLCGDTCDRVRADPDGRIDLIFGCDTNIDVR